MEATCITHAPFVSAILGSRKPPKRSLEVFLAHPWVNMGGFGDPKRIQKSNCCNPKWKSAKQQNPCFSFGFLLILDVREHWKSIKMGSSGYQNRCEMARGPKICILEAKNAVLRAILASLNLPKWNLGGLQGPRHRLTLARGGGIFFGFGPPKIDSSLFKTDKLRLSNSKLLSC